MPNPTDMSEAEIAAALTEITERERALNEERRALLTEVQRRATEARGEAVIEALRHERFGVSFDFRPTIFCRIPDSDWIEGEYDVQEVVSRVEGALASRDQTSLFVLGQHKFFVEYQGDRFRVYPSDRRDKDAWAVLLSLIEDRFPVNFDTGYGLDVVDVVLPTVRELFSRPEKRPEP